MFIPNNLIVEGILMSSNKGYISKKSAHNRYDSNVKIFSLLLILIGFNEMLKLIVFHESGSG